jgi:acyl-CoA thioesterase
MPIAHPFAQHIGMTVQPSGPGQSRGELTVTQVHLNPHGVAHGAVLFALVDTGMGAALYTALAPGQSCATIEIKINYLAPVRAGRVSCHTTLVRQGRNVAYLESRLTREDGSLVATASGNYALFELRPGPSTAIASDSPAPLGGPPPPQLA